MALKLRLDVTSAEQLAVIRTKAHSRLMVIRPETSGDEEAISILVALAFREADHGAGNEERIVDALREDKSLTVSLVAIENDRIIGHVAFSPIAINGHRDRWFGLGPLSVLPNRQGRGGGSALVEAGLERLRLEGAKGCVVLGDPAYYGRFGFRADPDFRLPGVAPDYFQRLMFEDQPCAGTVDYHRAFTMA